MRLHDHSRPCEHYQAAWAPGQFWYCDKDDCPGGATMSCGELAEALGVDYEAVAKMIRLHNEGRAVWPPDGQTMARSIINAALGIEEGDDED